MRLASSLSCQLPTQNKAITPLDLEHLFSLVEDWQKTLVKGMGFSFSRNEIMGNQGAKCSNFPSSLDTPIYPQNISTLNTHLNSVITRLLWLKLCVDSRPCRTAIGSQWSQYWLGKTQFDIFFQKALWPEFSQNFEGDTPKQSVYRISTVNPDGLQAVLQQIEAINLQPLIVKQDGPLGMASGLILSHVYEYLLRHPIGTHIGAHERRRKIQGCYYTPLEVVNSMVAQTLGSPLERGLGDRVTILDPACGAGIFLVIIYQRLLDWYALQSSDETLTFTTKKQILLRHIYGVDLDSQAVEVTRLSLLLVLMGNESLDHLYPKGNNEIIEDVIDPKNHENPWDLTAPISRSLAQLLSTLNQNIQWGNTLVGDDIFHDRLLSKEQRDRIHPFNWQTAFPHIFFPRKGFDIVIGNPPYIDAESMSRYQPEERQYCATHYGTASGNWDIFCVFCEKALQLCRPGGVSSFIVPNKLASADYAQATRHLLAVEHQLLYLRDYSAVSVFPIAVYPLVYVVQKASEVLPDVQPKRPNVQWERMVPALDRTSNLDIGAELEQRSLPYTCFSDSQRPWAIASTASLQALVTRIRHQGIPLGQMATVVGAATVAEAYDLKPFIQEVFTRGLSNGRGVHYLPKVDIQPLDPETDATYFKFVNSGTIDPYCFLWGQKPLRYLKQRFQCPVIAFSDEQQVPPKRWHQAHAAKIVVAGMTLKLECALDRAGEFFPGKSTTVIRLAENAPYDLRYLLAILNSTLMSVYFRTEFGGNALNGGYLRIGPPQIKQLPIYEGSKAQQAQLISLVDALQMAQNSGQEREREAIAHQIDQQVYALYKVSGDDIQLMNG